MLNNEQQYNQDGYDFVIGCDEAGRGPLAGPVVASAVCLKSHSFNSPIRDSKKLSLKQREKAFAEISEKSYFGIGIVNEEAIDQLNILQATFFAMNRAVEDLVRNIPVKITQTDNFNSRVKLLIDGNQFKSKVPYSYETIVKGDQSELSIACASIIAKVTRDRILFVYDKIYPEYGFSKHKGYPTKAHKQAIASHGLSLIHRKSFQYA